MTSRTIGQDPQISLTYDDAGNLTQDGDSDGDHKYVWDYRNRLIKVEEKQSGSWVTIAEMKYDGVNGRVLKTVSDTGIGIASKDQPKVFERFTQVGSQLTDKPPGTGIGLAICREIVEKSNGEVWVQSQLRQGSTFGFTLPVRQAE